MPLEFDRAGLRFDYPENWQIDDSDILAGRKSVTVYSPSGAFWSVAIHPRGTDAATLIEGVVRTMRAEYPSADFEPVSEILDGKQLAGYDITFFYLDFLNAAQIRAFETPWATYTFFCQGEDRDFDSALPVFKAMTVSLLRRLKG